MNLNAIDRLASKLRLGRKVRIIVPQVTTAQQAHTVDLLDKIQNAPAKSKVSMTTAAGNPRFAWGLYGMPPDDMRPWEMTD